MITRHSLPQNRLELEYGSQNNGSCNNISQSLDGSPVCAGTSVLNDDIIPVLNGVNTSNPTRASEWNKRKNCIIIDRENHDRMELPGCVQLSRDEDQTYHLSVSIWMSHLDQMGVIILAKYLAP